MQLQTFSSRKVAFLPSGILIVEPDPTLLGARARLLLAADNYVATSNEAAPGSELQELKVRVAILSQSLGDPMVEKVAQEVRLRYPSAAILIFGRCSPELNDQLYDEAIDAHSRPEQLLDVLFRLAQRFSSRLAPSHAPTGSHCLGYAGLGWIPLPNTPAESDPSKEPGAEVENLTTDPRDVPSDETSPHLV